MFDVLINRTYRRLFLAQVVALIGTGLTTVALGLLAFRIAGSNAGSVLGTALAIKMIAYVAISPFATVLADRFPRRPMLVSLDVARGAFACMLPFVTEIWQIYVLIFLLQSASAAFTPTFQATIPDVLPDDKDYTNALSLARLAYDLESLLSPVLAALLLTVISFNNLFAGTAIGFLGSALLVRSVVLPGVTRPEGGSSWSKLAAGVSTFLHTPSLRGLMALNLAVAAAGAMVFVNTVVLVKSAFGLSEQAVAWAMAAFGGGSMIAALILPRLLSGRSDRTVMLAGAAAMAACMFLGIAVGRYDWLLLLWFFTGFGYSLAQTPVGRLLRRASEPSLRPALFSGQFALSHLCWLLAYPVAGLVGARYGMAMSFAVLGAIAACSIAAAARLWPAGVDEG
ncbi:MFS transporter [Camelimonas fluminis]|uniref:MFS transporter n=1 Tax=Camelimonas fluminis TaxID=1576911 RepID=A0ABV7UC74_9HYPH|nr:MFS transporter [Camelimonas fluminis]GHE73568.1 MFS transporter [Camelimonas fluminis]